MKTTFKAFQFKQANGETYSTFHAYQADLDCDVMVAEYDGRKLDRFACVDELSLSLDEIEFKAFCEDSLGLPTTGVEFPRN